jgi:hypothetical protein
MSLYQRPLNDHQVCFLQYLDKPEFETLLTEALQFGARNPNNVSDLYMVRLIDLLDIAQRHRLEQVQQEQE